MCTLVCVYVCVYASVCTHARAQAYDEMQGKELGGA